MEKRYFPNDNAFFVLFRTGKKHPTVILLSQVNNENTRTVSELCSNFY